MARRYSVELKEAESLELPDACPCCLHPAGQSLLVETAGPDMSSLLMTLGFGVFGVAGTGWTERKVKFPACHTCAWHAYIDSIVIVLGLVGLGVFFFGTNVLMAPGPKSFNGPITLWLPALLGTLGAVGLPLLVVLLRPRRKGCSSTLLPVKACSLRNGVIRYSFSSHEYARRFAQANGVAWRD